MYLEYLKELENISQNITKEGLTKIYSLENIPEMQIDFIYYCFQGLKPAEAAAKAGYKHPRAAASKLMRKKKIQSVFEEQRNLYLQTNKFGVDSVLGILEKTIKTGVEGYDAIEYDEKTIERDGKIHTIPHKKIKKVKELNTAVHAISVWADIMGAKASDAVREKLADIKKNELALKKKDIAVKEGMLALEKEKAREQIENYEKKINRKVTIEVVRAKNENS